MLKKRPFLRKFYAFSWIFSIHPLQNMAILCTRLEELFTRNILVTGFFFQNYRFLHDKMQNKKLKNVFFDHFERCTSNISIVLILIK